MVPSNRCLGRLHVKHIITFMKHRKMDILGRSPSNFTKQLYCNLQCILSQDFCTGKYYNALQIYHVFRVAVKLGWVMHRNTSVYSHNKQRSSISSMKLFCHFPLIWYFSHDTHNVLQTHTSILYLAQNINDNAADTTNPLPVSKSH